MSNLGKLIFYSPLYVYSTQAHLSTHWSNRPFITDRYFGQVGDVDDNGDVDFRKSTSSKDRQFLRHLFSKAENIENSIFLNPESIRLG